MAVKAKVAAILEGAGSGSRTNKGSGELVTLFLDSSVGYTGALSVRKSGEVDSHTLCAFLQIHFSVKFLKTELCTATFSKELTSNERERCVSHSRSRKAEGK